jgi:hypothetical protein
MKDLDYLTKESEVKDGSVSAWIAALPPGGYYYVEVPYEEHAEMMRKLNPGHSRRPPELRAMRFKTSLHTSIGNGDPTDVRYLVKVERLQ